ncbi:PepSY domain-containing protein [Streptomyces sp. NPDC050147]|uniref:PepSY domain-containing protein n=1 Tax=Streptomyces sp. NPDC050147 TaxID=3155513 RepID=UPI00342F40EC
MKRNIVIATVAAIALVGGGTATALAATGDDESSAAAKKSSVQLKDDNRDDDRDDRDDDRYDDQDDAKENTAEAKAAKVSAADAIDAALAKHSGTAVSAELDDEDGGLVWDVDLLKGDAWTSVQVDPGTGKVLGSHTEQDDDGDAKRVAAALKGASVNAEDAAKAAGAKGTVTSVDLDDDGTAGAWEAETSGAKGAESDWKVDLQSGKVTADKSDSHDDSDHDSDDNDSNDDSDGSDD